MNASTYLLSYSPTSPLLRFLLTLTPTIPQKSDYIHPSYRDTSSWAIRVAAPALKSVSMTLQNPRPLSTRKAGSSMITAYLFPQYELIKYKSDFSASSSTPTQATQLSSNAVSCTGEQHATPPSASTDLSEALHALNIGPDVSPHEDHATSEIQRRSVIMRCIGFDSYWLTRSLKR